VREVLGLLGVSVASALLPLINIELYLVGLAAVAGSDRVWLLAAVGGFGQMVGKVIWYYLGANSLRWGWIRKKVETPKAQAKLELWQRRTRDQPVLGALLLFVSGFSGFPPFAIVSVLAGQLRMNIVIFIVVGFVGRTLRFAAFLEGAGWISEVGVGLF
jgi:membrane protein YqaA with SNARE-associated domain